MVGIYVGGTSAYCGKHTIAMSLAVTLQEQGYRIGYMKPVGTLPLEKDGRTGDEDAFFMQEVLGLSEDPQKVTPVVVDQDFRMKTFRSTCEAGLLMGKIKSAYQELGRDKDVMIVVGAGSMLSGKYCNLDGVSIVRALDLYAIGLDRYVHHIAYDYFFWLQEVLQEKLLGVLLNDIPPAFQSELDTMLIPMFKQKGLCVLGVVPRDPLLGAISVSELAQCLGGRLLCASSKSERVVEDFLIGTMQVENFTTYFKKKRNTAIIVGGDRSDVQFVALEGECPCLILTGNIYPSDVVMTRAEALDVPVLVVRDDTYVVSGQVEDILNRHKQRDRSKVEHVTQFVSSYIDLDAIKNRLKF